MAGRQAPAAGHCHFGPGREAHEPIWTNDAHGAMTEFMTTLPAHWRFCVRQRLLAVLPAASADGAADPGLEAR